jgi:hypothetical protein
MPGGRRFGQGEKRSRVGRRLNSDPGRIPVVRQNSPRTSHRSTGSKRPTAVTSNLEIGALEWLAEEVFVGRADYTRGRIFDERIAIAAYDYHGSACRFGHEQAGGGGKFIGDS